ncbi:3-oxoacyl-(acyl carrier protein) synthase III [Candidatus Rubidus massiliensis]|nr:3-oxoacyl-(acyl carrier protein) synthase III [Candidatus Rubidus massiliensis]
MLTNNVATIIAAESALPSSYYTTDEILEKIQLKPDSSLSSHINNLGVEGRYISLDYLTDYLTEKENRICKETAKSLAISAIKKCIAKSDVDPLKIDLLITVTNTQDRPMPCLACEAISEVDQIRKDINNLNLQNQGCSVFPKALDIANAHLLKNPGKYVLIVLSEAHSLFFAQFQVNALKALHDCKSKKEFENTIRFISAMLFGDGAVAFILGSEGCGLKMNYIGHITNFDKSHAEVIHMDEGGALIPSYQGIPFYHMTKDIAQTGILYAQKLLDSLRKQKSASFCLSDYDHLFIHTGSKKILDGLFANIFKNSNVQEGQLSYDILKKYGNLSSVSVPMMIYHFMQKPVKDKQCILALTFGVGFSGSIVELSSQ